MTPRKGDPIPAPCSDQKHGVSIPLNRIEFDPTCLTCVRVTSNVEHTHLHDAPPYKAACPLCSSRMNVRCSCGEVH